VARKSVKPSVEGRKSVKGRKARSIKRLDFHPLLGNVSEVGSKDLDLTNAIGVRALAQRHRLLADQYDALAQKISLEPIE
jgi:hypothetical protein